MFVNVANGAGPGLGAVARRPVASAYRSPNGRLYVRLPLVLNRRGMGDATLFTRPGANGGTQIVDSGGNTVYTPDQVAADPGLIARLGSSSGCANGTLPIWFPGVAATGGGPVCGDPTAIVPGEGNSPFAQFEYPVNGQCNQNVWCMFGSNPNDPNSYVWNGSGQPDTMNPALVNTAGVPYPVGVPVQTAPDTVPFYPTVVPVPRVNPVSIVVSNDPVPTSSTSPGQVTTAVSIANTSRPGQSFQVGDSWRLTITGAPNSPVIGTASQNGQSLGATPYGNTDATGTMVLTGSMDPSTVGTWSELWTVSGSSASVNFSVSAAPGSPAPTPADTSASSSAGSISDFMTQSVSIAGISVPLWGALAAGAVALLMFSGGGSRR